MADEEMTVEDVSAQVQSLLDTWNPPADDGSMQYLIGVPREQGDGRATASPTDPNLQHPLNPAMKGDAQRVNNPFTDDADEDYSGKEWSKDALKEEVERRNSEMDDEDNHLAVSGTKDELRERLVADDSNRAVEQESE
jgi:hypothetical protein